MNITRKNFLWWISGTLVTAGLAANNMGCIPQDEQTAPADIADKVEKEIEGQLENTSDLAHVDEVHKRIIAVQLSYMQNINNIEVPNAEQLKNINRRGNSIFQEKKMDIDPDLFLEIMNKICSVIEETTPAIPEAILTLSAADEFREENLKDFVQKISLLNHAELQKYISEKGLDTRTGLDSEIISFVLFMSLSPFYCVYTEKVGEEYDFSLWREGHCPICGQTAVIARHQREDGARVLFCWLCHAEWHFPRMECPYCGNNDQSKLRFFYVQGDKTRQVHVCEKCKRYLKTVDGKIIEKDMLLNVEEVATEYLDTLAQKEGYKRPDRGSFMQ